ncbi:MAG: hypothetical protein F6J87_06190 [Spirulina sp. SIO3F2]|nr:hypothetical protein [Spirulina sp. SIO3F2]
MNLSDLSLSKCRDFEDFIPALGNFPSRVLARNYDEFIECLYKDVDTIVGIMQEDPGVRQNDSEDRLSSEILASLRSMGYQAERDATVGGHCDLVIRRKIDGSQCIWLGEAKKFSSSYVHLLEGFHQLFTRYSTGDDNQTEGGIIIYYLKKDTRTMMQKWKDKLNEAVDVKRFECCPKKTNAFYSFHEHPRSGLLFKVRHIPVNLHFDPQDKSGKKSQRNS